MLFLFVYTCGFLTMNYILSQLLWTLDIILVKPYVKYFFMVLDLLVITLCVYFNHYSLCFYIKIGISNNSSEFALENCIVSNDKCSCLK